jgi:hypothetical protein
MDISRVRQRQMLPRLLAQLAARSGQVLNITPTAGAIGLERSTAENYVKLLEAVFLVQRLPARSTPPGVGHDPWLADREASEGACGRFRRDGLAAFEIKAGTRVSSEDMRGLRHLRPAWPAPAGSHHLLHRRVRLPPRRLDPYLATQPALVMSFPTERRGKRRRGCAPDKVTGSPLRPER